MINEKIAVYDIVKKYLDNSDFDGLYLPDCCACKKDDLAPCSAMNQECRPGYLMPGDEDFDFLIGESTK